MEWNHCLILLSVFWTQVYCGGKIWLKLVNFSNSRGKGANNHYCDGKYFIRGSDCDHRFILCLDDTNGPQITSVCKYGRVRTSTIFNTNYITFGSKIGGTPNPMTFSFNTWRGKCKLKVDIYDDDDNADDYVDFVSTYYYQFMPGYNESTATATTVTMKHRITLTVQLKVYCDPDYYGMQCSTYCSQSEKYRCEVFTGQKICLGDWTGPDCNVKKDACMSGPCQNEGTCHNSFGSYLCVCKPGYTGNQCQQDVDECASLPCRNNGTCVDLLNHYQCTCPYGYSSKDCSSVLDLCNNNPCLNNGSCRMDQNNAMFHCDCTEEWEGHLCGSDVNECENEICQNNSTCENTQGGFHCHCADGWTGVKCQNDIDECLIMSCFGNSSCHNTNGSFFCACAEGYTGHLCEIDMDECMSSPCLNGGICHDEVNGFTCECARGYTGVTCKEEIDECAGTNDKILIYMDGIIKSEDQDRILDKIKLVIQKYGDLDIGVVDLRGNTERLEDTKGKTVTRLSLSLLLNGSTICGESLDALKGLLKLDENEFPYVFYHGDIANFKANPVVKKQKMTQKTWFKDKWYMVLAVVGSIFIIAGVLFVILRHKRKKQRALVNGQLSMNNSIQWHSENSTHSTLPPLSFDNDLYQSAHQSYQPQMTFEQKSIEASDTMIDSLQPSSAFENELYQTTIPHEQARLMYDFECFDDN